MKKKYVNLKIQVVNVQLSDCIAGSTPVSIKRGSYASHEIDGTQIENINIFSKW